MRAGDKTLFNGHSGDIDLIPQRFFLLSRSLLFLILGSILVCFFFIKVDDTIDIRGRVYSLDISTGQIVMATNLHSLERESSLQGHCAIMHISDFQDNTIMKIDGVLTRVSSNPLKEGLMLAIFRCPTSSLMELQLAQNKSEPVLAFNCEAQVKLGETSLANKAFSRMLLTFRTENNNKEK